VPNQYGQDSSFVQHTYPAVVKLDMATLSGRTTGTPVWVCNLPSGRYSAVIASPDDSKVFVFGRHFRVSAHDTRTGTELWSFDGGSGEISFLTRGVPFVGVCDDRAVYVGSSDGYVYGINSVDGSLRWRYFAGGYSSPLSNVGCFVGSLPVCSRDGSRVVVGTTSSQVAVLDASTGDLLWKSVTGQYNWNVQTYQSCTYSIMSAPIINPDNTRVYTYGQAFGSSALLSLDINSMPRLPLS
jgi:outer membrane protein assembly factor BamB